VSADAATTKPELTLVRAPSLVSAAEQSSAPDNLDLSVQNMCYEVLGASELRPEVEIDTEYLIWYKGLVVGVRRNKAEPSVATTTRDKSLGIIFGITRLSGRPHNTTRADLEEKYLSNNIKKAEFYLENHHQRHHPYCDCKPKVVSLLLITTSNRNFSQSNLRELRLIKQAVATANNTVAICTSGTDGFSTNCVGFEQFLTGLTAFTASVDLMIIETNRNWRVFTAEELLATFTSIDQQQTPVSAPAYLQISAMAKIAVHKAIISQAKAAILKVQPFARNGHEIRDLNSHENEDNEGLLNTMAIADKVSTIASKRGAAIVMTQEDINAARAPESKRAKLVASLRKPEIFCTRIELETDERGNWRCPERDCLFTCEESKEIASHIARKSVDDKVDNCILCDQFCGHTRPITQTQNSYRSHRLHILDHHIKPLILCPGCGVEHREVYLQAHIANAHPEIRWASNNRKEKEKDYEFVCLDCLTVLESSNGLQQHFRRMHENTRADCPNCDRRIPLCKFIRVPKTLGTSANYGRDLLREHQLSECDQKQRIRVVCPICEADISRSHLYDHLKGHAQKRDIINFAAKLGICKLEREFLESDGSI
jgi:hypothetical protein